MAGVVGGVSHPSTLRAALHRSSERADLAAVAWAPRPLRAARLLVALALAGAAIGVPAGLLLRDDPAVYFREGMPGTWLSGAMLLVAAIAARAVHRRDGEGRWHASFWGLSAAALALLVVVELLQPTIFLGHWLEDSLGAVAPWGFRDVDSVLVVALLVSLTLLLARHALVLRRHPAALALFVVSGLLAAASQGLDSFWPATDWEFVAEETLKALAEAVLVAAYLTALRDVLARSSERPRQTSS